MAEHRRVKWAQTGREIFSGKYSYTNWCKIAHPMSRGHGECRGSSNTAANKVKTD